LASLVSLRGFCVTRLPRKGDVKGVRKKIIAKRLRKGWASDKARRQSARAISGCKDEGDAALTEQVRNWEDHRFSDFDVEDGRIQLDIPRQSEGILDLRGRPNHFAAKIKDHVLDQHGDHRLVLDNKDATTGTITHGLLQQWGVT